METTAVYDPKTDEFIVNTPTPLAQKYWITNGAIHAKHCIVFAQLNVGGISVLLHLSWPIPPAPCKGFSTGRKPSLLFNTLGIIVKLS